MVTGKRGGVREARILEVLQPSAERVTPACVVAGSCGGCDWLHLTAQAQATHKSALADDALRRIGRFSEAEVAAVRRPLVLSSSSSTGSGRRRTRIVIGRDGEATYSAANSHERVSVRGCPALHPALDAAIAGIARAGLAPGTSVKLAVDDRGHVVAATSSAAARALVQAGVVVGAVVADHKDESRNALVVGDALLHGEITAGLWPEAISDAATFAQATRDGGLAITAAVLAAVDEVIDGARVLELFCGSGHLTLPLAARAAHVHAVEGDRRALRHLEHNRGLVRGLVTVEAAFIDADFPFAADTDVVVIDPPRTGIVGARAMLAALAKRTPTRRLVMVSCDPATGARDLRAAVDAGFKLTALTPIDAFPQTHHLEWVASLSR